MEESDFNEGSSNFTNFAISSSQQYQAQLHNLPQQYNYATAGNVDTSGSGQYPYQQIQEGQNYRMNINQTIQTQQYSHFRPGTEIGPYDPMLPKYDLVPSTSTVKTTLADKAVLAVYNSTPYAIPQSLNMNNSNVPAVNSINAVYKSMAPMAAVVSKPQLEIITGIVTQIQETFGMISGEIFFNIGVVVGSQVQVHDKVVVEAERVNGMPFKFNAKKVQLLSRDLLCQSQGDKNQEIKSSLPPIPINQQFQNYQQHQRVDLRALQNQDRLISKPIFPDLNYVNILHPDPIQNIQKSSFQGPKSILKKVPPPPPILSRATGDDEKYRPDSPLVGVYEPPIYLDHINKMPQGDKLFELYPQIMQFNETVINQINQRCDQRQISNVYTKKNPTGVSASSSSSRHGRIDRTRSPEESHHRKRRSLSPRGRKSSRSPSRKSSHNYEKSSSSRTTRRLRSPVTESDRKRMHSERSSGTKRSSRSPQRSYKVNNRSRSPPRSSKGKNKSRSPERSTKVKNRSRSPERSSRTKQRSRSSSRSRPFAGKHRQRSPLRLSGRSKRSNSKSPLRCRSRTTQREIESNVFGLKNTHTSPERSSEPNSKRRSRSPLEMFSLRRTPPLKPSSRTPTKSSNKRSSSPVMSSRNDDRSKPIPDDSMSRSQSSVTVMSSRSNQISPSTSSVPARPYRTVPVFNPDSPPRSYKTVPNPNSSTEPERIRRRRTPSPSGTEFITDHQDSSYTQPADFGQHFCKNPHNNNFYYYPHVQESLPWMPVPEHFPRPMVPMHIQRQQELQMRNSQRNNYQQSNSLKGFKKGKERPGRQLIELKAITSPKLTPSKVALPSITSRAVDSSIIAGSKLLHIPVNLKREGILPFPSNISEAVVAVVEYLLIETEIVVNNRKLKNHLQRKKAQEIMKRKNLELIAKGLKPVTTRRRSARSRIRAKAAKNRTETAIVVTELVEAVVTLVDSVKEPTIQVNRTPEATGTESPPKQDQVVENNVMKATLHEHVPPLNEDVLQDCPSQETSVPRNLTNETLVPENSPQNAAVPGNLLESAAVLENALQEASDPPHEAATVVENSPVIDNPEAIGADDPVEVVVDTKLRNYLKKKKHQETLMQLNLELEAKGLPRITNRAAKRFGRIRNKLQGGPTTRSKVNNGTPKTD